MGRADELKLNFDPGWKFIKADPTNAFLPGFDDKDWTTVSLPHTYNDTDTFDHFSLPGHRGEQAQWGGRTWYRKTFSLPKNLQGKKVYIEFEAARQVAEIYLNGHLLGVSKNGFVPFGFDLTPRLRFDAPNVLAVMCDNRFMKDPLASDAEPVLSELSKQVNAAIPDDIDQLQADQIPWNNPHWHPAHGGLYRNVYLHVCDPLHISLPLYSFLQTAGPYIYATDISTNSADVHLQVPIENGRGANETIQVTANILDRDGKTVLTLNQAGEAAANAQTQIALSGKLDQPQLWEPDFPCLYKVEISLRTGGKTVDANEIPFGIRTVRWNADTGFWINGHHVKLHGWGQKPTDEWPGLGAAQPDWLHYYTLSLMREAGGNWVRWGHCAGSPAMLAAGDQLGIMAEQPGVDGESDTVGAAWKLRAAAFRDTLVYFRNHPSIMMWEGGNQKVTRAHAAELRNLVNQFDPNGGRAFAFRRADAVDGKFADVDLGTEGGRQLHGLPLVEAEYDREESPRRVWDDFSPPNFGYPEAKGKSDYVLTSEQYAINEVSQYLDKIGATNHCGGANWIFSDSTSGGRDAAEVTRASGEVDGVRLPKEAYYVCQVLFRDDPQIHIIGHWNYPAGTRKTIYVASNCQGVELFVNGKSLGHGAMTDQYLFVFPNVEWQPGEIKAVGFEDGKAITTDSIRTAGPPVALRLTPITGPKSFQADGSDVALLDVEAVDASGQRCPTFQQRVDFDLSGSGIWRGGYNSGKTNSINNQYLDLECGINRVAVRSTLTPGPVTVSARCGNLKPASITLDSRPFEMINGYSLQMPPLPSLPPLVPLAKRPIHIEKAPFSIAEPNTGRFLKTFSYSGPATAVSVQQNAREGAKIYADSDDVFAALPDALKGSDWVQTAAADKFYSAADLMNFAANGAEMVYVAHDERLPAPTWLARQFQPAGFSATIAGQRMKIFERAVREGESLTLGSNTDDNHLTSCNMYVVFVKRADATGRRLTAQIN